MLNSMENQRIILYIALAMVCFALWGAWQKDYPSKPAVNTTASVSALSTAQNIPTTINNTTKVAPVTTTAKTSNNVPQQIVTVKTDVLNVKIDTAGGNIVGVQLPKYPEDLSKPNTPLTLLNNDANNFYIAESALISSAGPDNQAAKAQYSSEQTSYNLSPDQNTLQVKLDWSNKDGLQISKIFTFTRSSYLINVAYVIQNNSTQNWTGNLYTQLTRNELPNANKGMFQIHPYIGAAISSPDDRYQEISFNKMQSEPVNTSIQNGWAAMVQHYFLGAWIPNPQQNYHYYSNVNDGDTYTIGMMSPTITVAPGQQVTQSAKLYTGPEVADVLKNIAPGLDLTVSYGWLWPIAVAIFWLMKHIYNIIGNWGWSIIIVTLLIKLVFYHLSAKSYRSMAKMRQMQPKIEAIRERLGDDKQKLSQAMMELYKTEKINPLGGCLPILVQIPVFFALYMVLIESVELRQAPWIGWIHDLSIPDPYFILPVIMGVTMFIQQKLNPPPADPTQAKVMMFLPLLFTYIFIHFPAGLVLYWVVNNALSILQQWHVMRKVEAETPKKKKSTKKVHA